MLSGQEKSGQSDNIVRKVYYDRPVRSERWTWWIGWSRRFENMWRIQWTERLRWFMWKGWACSKRNTKSGEVDEDAKELG